MGYWGGSLARFGLLAAFLIHVGLSGAAEAMTAKQPADLVVEGAYVVTMNAEALVIRDGAVAIHNGAIVGVGTQKEIRASFKADEVMKGDNNVVLPGLVNGHTHTSMTLFRGIADDLDLMTWLQEYIFPMEGQFVDEEFVRIGTQLACWEMIRGGTTSFVDMYFYPDVISEVVNECGVRAIVGAPMIDFPSPGFQGWDDSFAAGVAYAKRWKGKNSRVTPALAPHAPYTVSPEHLEAALNAAKELDVPITTHVAEAKSETADIIKRYGASSVRHLGKIGYWEHDIIAAHMIWPDEEEMEMIAGKSVGAIHNPTSNMKTASGFSPVPEMIGKGVKVGLGTDGTASNNDLDMWDEMRLAALIHKGRLEDPTAMPAEAVLRMATSGGAHAIGLGDVTGSLEVGKRADVIQVSLDSLRLAPMYDITSHLIYVAGARDVVTTIVDGKVLMRDGAVLTIDTEKLRQEVEGKTSEIKAALAKK